MCIFSFRFIPAYSNVNESLLVASELGNSISQDMSDLVEDLTRNRQRKIRTKDSMTETKEELVAKNLHRSSNFATKGRNSREVLMNFDQGNLSLCSEKSARLSKQNF